MMSKNFILVFAVTTLAVSSSNAMQNYVDAIEKREKEAAQKAIRNITALNRNMSQQNPFAPSLSELEAQLGKQIRRTIYVKYFVAPIILLAGSSMALCRYLQK